MLKKRPEYEAPAAPWNNHFRRQRHYLARGHVMRRLYIARYLSAHLVRKVQFAPGELPTTQAGWLTADVITGDIYCDARRRLPFPSNSLDFAFSEHFLEHLTFGEALRFLAEVRRILKPGGVLRASLPDFRKLVRLYLRHDGDYLSQFHAQLLEWTPRPRDGWLDGRSRLLPAEAMNVHLYGFDHHALWDAELLMEITRALGFTECTEQPAGESPYPELRGLERHGEVDKLNEDYVTTFEIAKGDGIPQKGLLSQSVAFFLAD
jgi:SAM-dependent methyltransferase